MKAKTVTKQRKPKLWYKSNEIAHVWANEGAPEGKCSRSTWFDGTAFNSYATTIARILHTKKGERVYVLDLTSFSPITGSTQGKLWNAIPKDAIKFSVGDGMRGQSMNYTPVTLRDYYLDGFKPQVKRKMAHDKAGALLRRYHNLDEAIRVCEVFGLPKKELCGLRRRGKADVEEAREVCRLHDAKRDEKRKAREAKRLAPTIQAAIAYAATYIADPELVCYDRSRSLLAAYRPELLMQVEAVIQQRNAAAMEAWRNGEGEANYSWPTMLRREDDEMVTSHGARVPIADAERGYRFALKMRERGWRRNGEQFKVGMYDLDSVSTTGVICGCHRLSWEEILRFAEQQNWVCQHSKTSPTGSSPA